ncbi:IS66 family transposase [Marinivivus vitaminiproducens]|uniref:IS66 family transposase n=1 Tax=Marinivivus vitaminiproducens TaxID=3035935 RepID=UPI0027A62804|nr:IS66 family transposase [Geminicoccaceae bacterium SCSIO 64248]
MSAVPPAEIDLDALPAPVRAAFLAERAAREQLQAKVAALAAQNQRLEHMVREFRQALHGRKSEKLSADERQLAFEELETAVAEVETAKAAAEEASGEPRPRDDSPRRNLGWLPKELPRVERVVEPGSILCPCGCGPMSKIGEDRTERLDIIPAQFRVIATIRPKYACRACAGKIAQAPAPTHLIEGALPTEATLAHVLVSKYADHCPLYRQAQIYARNGLALDRSTLAGWVGKASWHLAPVVERLAAHLKASGKLFMDETTAPVLDPGRGRTKTGYLWALARDDRQWGGADPPGVVYFYAPGRGACHAEALLEGFTGVLQVDGYAAYKAIARAAPPDKPLRLAHCWAHGRRQLRELFDKDGSAIAEVGLRQIARLYRIEAEIRGRSAAERLAVRRKRSRPLVEAFGTWLAEQRARISAKSRLAEKLAYFTNHWDGLLLFLDDGRVDIDTNAVENAIRPLTLNRKNALFAGHDEGGASWGRIASLIETAKLNAVNPFDYLKATLEALANGHPQSRLDELMSWAFRAASS